MFWRKFRLNKQENNYNNYLENSIIKLKEGDIKHLPIVYCAFATHDSTLIQNAGSTISAFLQNYTFSQMIRLDEQFRQHTSMEWSIDWEPIKLATKIDSFANKSDYLYTLILGSFHPNGYFREYCINEMANYNGTLPYLILRMNDWVEKIRQQVIVIIAQKIKSVPILEVIQSLQAVDKVQGSQRRIVSDLEQIKISIFNRIESDIGTVEFNKIFEYDYHTRKSIYKFLFSKKVFTYEQADLILNKEKHSFCKSIIIVGIFNSYDCPAERVDLYLKNRNSNVRMKAIDYKYKKINGLWENIEELLLDTNHGVRDYVNFILHKHSDMDILTYYVEHLDNQPPHTAIVGVGENGNIESVPYLMPFLTSGNEKTVKLTLLSLSKLMGNESRELYWKYLFDERISVSNAGYKSIKNNRIRYGAEKLYSEFKVCKIPFIKRYILLLLLQEDSWDRLPYLLLLYGDVTLPIEVRKISDQISNRKYYAKISKEKATFIREVMAQQKAILPAQMIEQIEFDLKYVTKK